MGKVKKPTSLNSYVFRWFLQYHWLTLMIIAVLSVAVFYYPINEITSFKSFETLSFFLLCPDEKEDGYLSSFVDGKDVLSVDIHAFSSSADHLEEFYAAYGDEVDVYVLRDIDLADAQDAIGDLVIPLDKQIYGGLDTFVAEHDGRSYGIKIFDYADKAFNEAHRFVDLLDFDYDGRLYLCLGANGDNALPYIEDSVNDAAVKAVKRILEDYA